MKKTRKILSFVMAVVMLMSAMSISLFANAADAEEKKLINATFVLDKVDEKLAELDLNSKLSLPGLVESALKVMNVTVKLNSVNEITETLNSIAKSRSINGLLKLMGDLKDLNLKVWKTKYTRGTDDKDAAIIGAVVNFLKDNTTFIEKFLEGKLDIGLLGDIKIDGKTLNDTINGILGDEGVCGMLKGILAGLVYEKDSADYKKCVAKDFDKIIYEDIMTVGVNKLFAKLDEMVKSHVEGEDPFEPLVFIYNDGFRFVGILDGFKYDSSKTLDGLIADIANAAYAKLRPTLKKMVTEFGGRLNNYLAGQQYTAPFAGLYDFTKLNFVEYTSYSIKDLNGFIGTFVKQICAFGWNNNVNLGENLQNMFMWAIKNRAVNKDNDPYAALSGNNFADYALSLAKIVVSVTVNTDDRDEIVEKMNSCKNATEVITKLLPYLLNKKETVVSADSKTYEQVLGDVLGYYTKGIIPINWKPATSVWDVANEILNYYLVKWNVDGLFGLDMKNGDTCLAKLDAIEAILLKGMDYAKLSAYLPALLNNILALDLSKLVSYNVEAAFTNKNTNVAAASLACNIVNNLYNSILNCYIFTVTTTPATTGNDGSIVYTCNLDKKTVASVFLADKVNGNITLSGTSFVYSGGVYQPAVTVRDVKGKVLVNGTDYTVAYANNVNAGTATVTVTLKGKYSGTLTKTFKINAQDASKFNVALSASSYTYNGKANKPTVTVKNAAGKALKEGTDFTVAYANNTNVGTATATVRFIGNYSGTVTKTFKINAYNASKAKITLSKTKMTYTGKELKPKVTIVDANKNTLKAGTDYTVKYENNKKIGVATITITFKGNYTGTAKVTFKIVPKGTTLTEVTGGSNSLTAKWKKQAKQTTGYEIQYSTSKKFTKKTTKTVTVSKNKTTSKQIKKLKAGKTYYVRIRTYKTVKVNGKSQKLYSSWSKSKSVKLK